MVESGGDWSSWQRLFDLRVSRDERILAWLGKTRDKFRLAFKENWLKETTKVLTQQFHNRDTVYLNNEELEEELNEIIDRLEK